MSHWESPWLEPQNGAQRLKKTHHIPSGVVGSGWWIYEILWEHISTQEHNNCHGDLFIWSTPSILCLLSKIMGVECHFTYPRLGYHRPQGPQVIESHIGCLNVVRFWWLFVSNKTSNNVVAPQCSIELIVLMAALKVLGLNLGWGAHKISKLTFISSNSAACRSRAM